MTLCMRQTGVSTDDGAAVLDQTTDPVRSLFNSVYQQPEARLFFENICGILLSITRRLENPSRQERTIRLRCSRTRMRSKCHMRARKRNHQLRDRVVANRKFVRGKVWLIDSRTVQRSASAFTFTTDLASFDSALSVAFSSARVASSREAASGKPSSLAQVFSVPYRDIS